ncbi:MAG: hypothetical protein RBR30_10130 [Tenuifilaceae bacterium]|nr:hypothetical protein [Tenuifilaceae bacterium]
MKVSRLVIRFWWFLVLLVVAGYFLASNVLEARRSEHETGFAIDNVDRITRISLTQGSEHILLQRTSSNAWLINDEAPASSDAVNALLRVLARLQSAGPVPISANDTLLQYVSEQGVKVEVFSNRRKLRSFFAATVLSQSMGNIAHMENAERVYRISLPRYEGPIADLFKTVPEYWVGNQIPTPSLESINAVQVEIPADLEQSYRIHIADSGEFSLYHIFSGTEVSSFDLERVKRLVSNLTQITYTSMVSMSQQERAEVIYSEPDFIYTIFSPDDSKFELKVYPIPVDEYIDELGRPVNVDLNRLYVTVSGSSQVFVVNYIDIHSVLQGLSWFIP